MAGIWLITRGHHDFVEKWQRSMKSQMYPMDFVEKAKGISSGSEYTITNKNFIEAQLRPIQLWEYVVPDDWVLPVCKNLGLPEDETYLDADYDEEKQTTGNQFMSGFGIKGYLALLRKMLKAEKIPKQEPNAPAWPVPIIRENVNVLGIGYRMDGKIKTVAGEHDRL